MATTYTVDYFMSLDGYGTAVDWPGYWGKEGPELLADRERTFAQEQVLVFGATTFREFSQFVVDYDEPYYESLNRAQKLVFSSTLEEPVNWENSTVINEDAASTIERLKRETDVPMRSHGSLSLNRALLAAGLVDRLEVMLFPVVTAGSGRDPLLRDGAEFDLDLVETTVLDGRTVKLVYEPRVHGAVPEGVGPKRR